MELSFRLLDKLSKEYGTSFYLFDEQKLYENFCELKQSFVNIYPKVNIAYSYKTNYLPRICQIINELGGYAEIVSDMEYELSQKIKVKSSKIIFNGPYKNHVAMEKIIINGGYVNIDSENDFLFIKTLIKKYPDKMLKIGIRCNFDIQDGVISRFGVDVNSTLFKEIIACIKDTANNMVLRNLQCHFATRSLDYWHNRAKGIFKIIDQYELKGLEHIDLGGGLFGKMPPFLKEQFSGYIPSYAEYAKVIATQFAERYADINEDERPILIIEPGSAIVGDVMKFATPVTNIKNVRDKDIATVLGSIYNINPTLNTKNPPIEIFTSVHNKQFNYTDLDFGGFTCIESDYLYKHFNGKLSVGDYVVFGNVGSYSIVLKPPFILPNFAIVSIKDQKIRLLKRKEKFDDLFHTFIY